MPAASAERLSVDGREVTVTNPRKVLFPQTGYTKLDLVRYFLHVASGALRGSGNRPNMLVRYPNGIARTFSIRSARPASDRHGSTS